MKTIYNKISNIINSMLEEVGYFLIGYKVDISTNEYSIKALRDTQSHNINDIEKIKSEDIQGLKYHIKAIRKYKIGLHEFGELKKEVEAVKDTINILRRDCKKVQEINKKKFVVYSNRTILMKDDIKEVEKNLEDFTSRYYRERFVDDMKETILTTPFKDRDFLTKPSKNIDDNVLMLENIINVIIETKVNNACKIVEYGDDITLDKEPYQKYTIKEILKHYINIDLTNERGSND